MEEKITLLKDELFGRRLLPALALGILLLFAAGAHAATLLVTSTADDGSSGTLRAALSAAQSGDTINFEVTGTITLTSPLPTISASITIEGPGASQLTISGANAYQIFNVASGAAVTLSGMTIADGVNANGGAVDNAGTLTIVDCTLTGSSGTKGAIYNDFPGTLTMTDSTFTGNSGSNGALLSYGTVAVSGSTFTGNTAPSGDAEGAAINSLSGSLTVTNSTFVDNLATQGGAINAQAALTVTNSTFADNTATSSFGGGIYYQGSGTVVINNNIFVGNTAAIEGAGIGVDLLSTSATETENNNLFYQEVATAAPGSDCQCGNNNTNPIDADPKLAPLGHYGGPTQTMLPLAGSAAICAGYAALVEGTTTDQRGFPLSSSSCSNGGVDVGAVQTNYLTVTTLTDSDDGSCGSTCSLRDAIAQANNAGTGDIDFSPSLNGTITLTSPLTASPLTGQINISGPGSGTSPATAITVSGNGSTAVGSIFSIGSGAQVFLFGLTIANGNASNGGGIDNAGTLTVTNSTFTGNSTPGEYGGAIDNSGTLAVSNSTFSGNSSGALNSGDGDGGAMYNTGSLRVTNSTFSGNVSGGVGGAIYDAAKLTVTNSTFSANSSGNGGAIDVSGDGSATVTNNIFVKNASNGSGAGLFSSPDVIDVTGNLFFENVESSTGAESDCAYCEYESTLNTGNPLLAPLGNYGGPTQTMLPQPGSAAICAGTMSELPSSVTTDQRGFSRLNTSYSGSSCLDLGAVQTNYQSVQFTNTSLSGTVNSPVSPAPVVSVTENGQNIAGVPVTLTFSGTGTATGVGPVTTVAGVGASFSDLSVNAVGSDDQLSATLPITSTYSLSTPTAATLDIAPAAQTITFVPPVSQVTYGTAPMALSATSTSGLAVVFSVVSGPATLSGSVLTITGAGPVVVEASQAGNASFAAATPVERTITVNPAPLTVTVNSVSRAFGAANPTFTGTAATFVNGDTAASTGLAYSTTATTTSAAGTYPITAALTNSTAAQNYTLNVIAGTLTVTAASSPITWPAPAAIPYGTPLSTAQLDASASVAGSFVYSPPAGTVLNAGTQTLSVTFTPASASDYATASATTTITVIPATPVLSFPTIPSQVFGNAPLAVSATSTSPGAIVYSVVSGPATVAGNLVTLTGAGTVVLSASQAAYGNYAAATATTSFTVTASGFTLSSNSVASSGSTSTPIGVQPGGAAVFPLTLIPAGSTYPDAVNLSVSGLPPGATATFSPSATIAAGSPATPITLTIQTSGTQTARNERPDSPVALGLGLLPFLVPFVGLKRVRRRLGQMPRLCLALFAAMLSLGMILGMSGCGGAGYQPQQQSYTVVVTATDATTHLQSSIDLTFTIL